MKTSKGKKFASKESIDRACNADIKECTSLTVEQMRKTEGGKSIWNTIEQGINGTPIMGGY